ncbi:DUF421 domain-containing protein [Paenibacillus sp. S-38]|uniref:DUF421 domain-containing protein n=1 Tax=Paenibacillus sp. S-38 TaxID=3416710 RepID=UPI003CF3B281
MDVLELLGRVLVAFISLLGWSRVIGKKLISHMTFFDFVCGVAFGAIGGNMIFNHLVPLWQGVIGISCFSLLTLGADFISLKSGWGRRMLESKPKLIVENGQIHMKAMKEARLTVHDLLMLLRKKDCFHLGEIAMAIFETDGSISLLKKTDKTYAAAGIIDGRIEEENLRQIGKNAVWMRAYLEEKNLELEQVILAQIDTQGDVHLFLK